MRVTLPYRILFGVLYVVSGYDLLSALILSQQKPDQNNNAIDLD